MIVTVDQLDDWCASVPGLQKVGDRAWVHPAAGDISYPHDGLAVLVEIEPRSYWFNHRNAVIAAVVRQFPPPGPILDIGGGNGYVSLGLEKAGFPAIVVEPDATGIATAREHGLPTIQAAFQTLDLPSASVPSIGLFDVLEHIGDEAGALVRVYEALQPGGMAYISVPAYNFLWSAEDVHAGHFRRYSVARLRRAMRQAGLTPIFATYFFAALVPAVLAFRTLPSLIGLRKRESRKSSQEHSLPDNAVGGVMQWSFSSEFKMINGRRRVPIGTSAFVAAIRN